MKSNDFDIDLEYSLIEKDNEIFDNFYKRVFPGVDKIEFFDALEMQFKGIDKRIWLKGGNSFTIDEKKRRKKYPDILLEIWSNFEKKKPGWLFTCQCDYIVYAIMPNSKIYMLPSILLKKAFISNRKKWLSYRSIEAKTKDKNTGEYYTTLNRAIPTKELLTAISKEMEHNF